MGYPVSRVAALAGVTVRTLHHYDDIGLLVPGERTSAGYRVYTDADLERLQQIRFYRELGFGLDEIAVLLDTADPREHFRRQHRLLLERIKKLTEMATAIEFAMEAQKVGVNLTPEERFEVFGDVDPERHADEAEERWGGTDAYAESQRRTGRYSKDDWLRFRSESEDWGRRFAAVMDSGQPAEGRAAMDLAEEHRQQISQWFYECTYEIHTGLADMYVADPRFTAFYENLKPGMARFLNEAIHANAVARS
ncbi:HTH-type transcriptional activator TipA [Asanoa ishikariensis]|uniref:DNA-binding transcriptional regulator, MerR family n=1 Tax=Asanoa ishikariensis TaxID=137265 RepID=A0A1H3NWV2_9ACTN|nr:MerR family transcriptional regulator [Asanoa ishikariensis]GIF68293.1 HTH-type transcriptional activator TipA [Asanoa ishikariensis]SDY93308.1 DNA-binding transcriptional regulator, MerR family [Asanoa ishikariensis]